MRGIQKKSRIKKSEDEDVVYFGYWIIRLDFLPHHLPAADTSGDNSIFISYNFIQLFERELASFSLQPCLAIIKRPKVPLRHVLADQANHLAHLPTLPRDSSMAMGKSRVVAMPMHLRKLLCKQTRDLSCRF